MSALNGKEILAIDDQGDVLQIVKMILENEGATVTLAKSVEEGLKIVQSKIPHLILTDLNMPGLDGFHFLKEKAGIQQLKGIPVVALSGLNDRESVQKAISLGAADYVLKPIRSIMLLQKVRKHLRDHSFLKFRFPAEQQPPLKAMLKTDILKVGEGGIRVESCIKLAPRTQVKVESPLMAELSCDQVILSTSDRPATTVAPWRFAQEIEFLGIGEEIVKKIRNYIKDWK